MHIAKTKENSDLRMTASKSLNCVLQILPLYYYTVIALTGDKQYWSDPANNKKWQKYFGSANIDRMKEAGTLHTFIRPADYLYILGQTGIINTDREQDKVRAVLAFQDFCKGAEQAVIEAQIKEQERLWAINPMRKEAEAEIQRDLNSKTGDK